MKVSVYVPRDLEAPLEEEAAKEGISPALFIQTLVRRWLTGKPRRFSEDFQELAGSWEDTRTTGEIVRDIEENRRSTRRAALE